MSDDWDFNGTLATIQDLPNPELWHVKNKTHAGIGWSIKTVIPKPAYADDSTSDIVHHWSLLCAFNAHLVTWTDAAYDWEGNSLEEWQTIWVKDGWDVILKKDKDGNLDHEIVPFERGTALLMENVIDSLRSRMASSYDANEQAELDQLIDLAEALIKQPSEQDVAALRKKIQVVDD